MGQIVPPGQFNPAALSADDLYIQIVNPPSYIRGVPTDVFGVIGGASWGPVNTPVHMGSSQDGALAFGPVSAASLTDAHDIATDIVLAFGQASSQASLEGWGVRVTDGTDTAASAGLTGAATSDLETATISGTVAAGDIATITFTSSALTGSPINVAYTATASDTTSTIAAALARLINANSVLFAAGVYASVAGSVVSIYQPTALSPQITFTESVTGSIVITLATGATVTTGITLTALYTGVLGNSIQAVIAAGSQTGGLTVTLIPPQGLAEVYPNIAGGNNFWTSLQSAINNGMSGVRGPSQLVKASNANNAVGNPTPATTTLSGGTDGRAGITTATLLGSDTAVPRTGMYALRNQSPAVGVVWLAGCTDSAAWASILAFCTSEGCSTFAPFPTGTSTATATAAVATNGIHDPSFMYAKDWIYFFDTINNQMRLVSPVAVLAGMWMTYSPEQSPGNKPVNLVSGTERNPPGQAAVPYTLSEIGQLANAGIMLITNPIPAGSQFGSRHGQTTSLSAATAPAEYWRMTAYLARSLNSSLGGFVDQLQSAQPNDPLRAAVRAQLNSFMKELQGLGQIDSFAVVCAFSASPSASPGMGINTPDSIAQHYLYALVQVKYLSSVRFFILSLQGGTTVVTVQNGNNQQQLAA